jgi:DNA-binding transcriptional MerR regulator
MSKTTLTIGELAKLGNVATSLLRYYEKEGLLEPAGRTRSGYRHYSADSVRHLRFIRKAQRYGFSLNDIKMMRGAAHEAGTGNDIKAIAEQRFIDIERRVTGMLVLRHELEIFLDDLADLISEQAGEKTGGQYRDLMEQVCGHEHGGTARSSLQKLTERMRCNLARSEWDKLLTDLRGCHMHIWQEADSYSTLFIGSGANAQKALETLAKSESSCVAHEQPYVEQTGDGILFTAGGNNAFLYAQLFLALEAPKS